MASEGDSSSTQSRESDPAWEYNILEADNGITCTFCNKVSNGGIDGAKKHQLGACSLCPQDVKDRLIMFIKKQKSKKRSGVHIGGQEKRMKSNVNSPNDTSDKERRARTAQAIARFFYDAGIPFHAARVDSFKEMIKHIGYCGPNFKPPTYHELRGPLLKNEVDNVNQWINGHKEEWSKYGCSIMLDTWTDREQRTIINVLVNSSKGAVFMKSVDASPYLKSEGEMYRLLDSFVEKIGEANVVQVITDNRSKSILSGKFLMVNRENLFSTPCAAHSIDLMLEDIGKISKVKTTIKRGIFLVGYIYNCSDVLNMTREFTKNKELTRTGITRFATTYLTLQSLHKQKASLKNMFASEKWTKSIWAKQAKGKTAKKVVSMPSFWKNVVWTLKVMTPLFRVLRLVKNEKKPAMGYMYNAMDIAKAAIRSALDEDDNKCKAVCDIIDKRWECQLHHPLQAAGYYFNPELYCTNPDIEKDGKVMKGLTECIDKLVPSHAKQDLIMTELIKWVNQAGQFRDDLAVRARGKVAPADWWKLYGKEIPNVQELAIKVLSLACSSSWCERNWSPLEYINSKKWNLLEHEKMQDVVFVKYNLTFKNRFNKDVVDDLISLEDIDYCNEWLIGKMEEEQGLEDDDDSTREDGVNASLEDDEEEEIDEEEFPYSNDFGDELLVDWIGDSDYEDEDDYDDDGIDYF